MKFVLRGWALRKLILIVLATISSEILSTSQTFATLFSNPLLLVIYIFSFIMMDELVQRYNFGNKAIFYMGAIFGLLLEGFVAFTLVADPLAPFVMIPLIAILWHGLITTLMSFTVVEVIIPRKEKKINKGLMVLGTLFWIGLLFITVGTNLALVFSQLFVYLIILSLILMFVFLIKRSLKDSFEYVPKINLSIILIVAGFIFGLLIEAKTFVFLGYLLMLIFYIPIIILLIRRRKR